MMPAYLRAWALSLLTAIMPDGAAAATVAAAPATSRQLTITAEGRTLRFTAIIDPALIDPTGDHETQVLGVRRGLALVLDSYASRPAALSRCQAGQERYVRLVDLSTRQERFSRLAESCVRDIVAGDPPAAWNADGTAVTINLVSQPPVRILVDPAGRVRVATR